MFEAIFFCREFFNGQKKKNAHIVVIPFLVVHVEIKINTPRRACYWPPRTSSATRLCLLVNMNQCYARNGYPIRERFRQSVFGHDFFQECKDFHVKKYHGSWGNPTTRCLLQPACLSPSAICTPRPVRLRDGCSWSYCVVEGGAWLGDSLW